MRRLYTLLLLLAFATTAAADPIADAHRLSWLEGLWGSSINGMETEERWMAPKAGSLLGLHRDVRGGKLKSFEFMRIGADGDTLAYFASPRAAPPTVFRLKELGEQRVVFENLEHDFPQRVLYWLETDGQLHARIEGMLKGKLESEEWVWRKVAP